MNGAARERPPQTGRMRRLPSWRLARARTCPRPAHGARRLMRPRTALALGLAGSRPPAWLRAAATRRSGAFELTLADGQVVTVTVDVRPGTALWPDRLPGIASAVARSARSPSSGPRRTSDHAAAARRRRRRSTGRSRSAVGRRSRARARQSSPRPARAASRQETTGPATSSASAPGRSSGAEEARAQDGDGDAGAGAPRRGRPADASPTRRRRSPCPGPAPIGVPNFFIDKFRIPPFLLSIYQAAGIEYGIRWEVLAAINEIETDYGRNLNVSSAGALGWMQFMPATWKRYGVDANGDKKKDPYNPVDAIFAAARYLQGRRAPTRTCARAIFAYNHADWYVDSVLMRARLIGGLPTRPRRLADRPDPGPLPGRRPRPLRRRRRRPRRRSGGWRRARNAALPVEADERRRDISIYAQPGSPVVAVQDGKVVRRGHNERARPLRRAARRLRQHLHVLAPEVAGRAPPGAARAARSQSAGMYANPPRDPAADAGGERRAQPAKSASPQGAAARARRAPPGRKERLFAAPGPPGRHGAPAASSQLAPIAGPRATSKLLGLPARPGRDEARCARARASSAARSSAASARTSQARVAARASSRSAPPAAARRASTPSRSSTAGSCSSPPRSTAPGRATRSSARDARTPSIGQILLMGKTELERRVLAQPADRRLRLRPARHRAARASTAACWPRSSSSPRAACARR